MSYFGALNAVQVQSHGDFSANGDISCTGNVSCSGNVSTATGTVSCQDLIVSGTTILPAASPSAGTVLYMMTHTLTQLGWTTAQTATAGNSPLQLLSFSYTPKSSNSYVTLFSVGYWTYINDFQDGSLDDWDFYMQFKVGSTVIGYSKHARHASGKHDGSIDTVMGRYTTTSTSPVTFSLEAIRSTASGVDFLVVFPDLGYLQISEVQR